MLPLNNPGIALSAERCGQTGLSTDFGGAPDAARRNILGIAALRSRSESEDAYIPRACDWCSSELNHVSGICCQGERKESIRHAIKTRAESSQFENKNRVRDALLKTPNTVGMALIKDFGWQRSIQAGEQVMACGAVGAARGYYAV